ncbi:MAG: hypothetical protein O7E57_07380 [Gammaproteobacteria bacterium]|nr:hypothetical protein [Gammaproteobacteria bacterium]
MTLMELGAVWEFLGAIGVIVTLIYLDVQIRQNTHAMKEGKRLALAQTYQMRADALQNMTVIAANSEYIGPIIIKLTELGYPEDIASLNELTSEERGRFKLWQIAQQTHWDNMFFQYQQGFLDVEYYQDAFRERVARLAPTWSALGLGGRSSFEQELADILEDYPMAKTDPT